MNRYGDEDRGGLIEDRPEFSMKAARECLAGNAVVSRQFQHGSFVQINDEPSMH